MNQHLERDLSDLVLILEDLDGKKDKAKEMDLIDMAARLKPAAKHIKSIDDYVKEMVKKELKHKEGTRLGNMFKAILKLVPTSRLDQKALKEERPKIHAMYLKDADDERVTFEVR